MGGSADNRVDAGGPYREVDPDSVQDLFLDACKYVPDHFAVNLFAELQQRYRGSLAFMKSGWISTRADS